MELTEHQKVHAALMRAICEVIHDEGKPVVLKGGTALLLGYDLDRFSEDLDFDLTKVLQGHINVESICRSAVKKLAGQGIRVQLAAFKELKKTDTTHRCRAMFTVGDSAPAIPLKIELSSRGAPDESTINDIGGIYVYSVNEVARLKLLAAQENSDRPYRTAARDLHDLAFIADQWEHELTDEVLADLEDFLADPAYLMERYSDAYDDDPLLHGRLFADLAIIEQWNDRHAPDDTPSLLGP